MLPDAMLMNRRSYSDDGLITLQAHAEAMADVAASQDRHRICALRQHTTLISAHTVYRRGLATAAALRLHGRRTDAPTGGSGDSSANYGPSADRGVADATRLALVVMLGWAGHPAHALAAQAG